jgi:DNA-binding NtrC family response regulator
MNRERILILEGDQGAGAALRAALVEHGLDAVEASSCEAGLALLASVQPAVVLADTGLPGCEGGALLARLHALRCDAAVVVSAGPDQLQVALAALRNGADAFLVRPLEPAHVAVALKQAAGTRRLRLEGERLH